LKKVDGIILEGEKIGLEKFAGRDNKMVVNLHLLNGFESISLRVKDANLTKQLEEFPNRKPIKVKGTVITFKDELYLAATSILS
jgi:myosin-crossreactive antigen